MITTRRYLLKLAFVFCLFSLFVPQTQAYDDDFVGGRTDFRDEMVYFAITTRFYDGDSGNNWQCWDNQDANYGDPCWRGDFKGLIDKMDYIKALGFTTIWITPVVEQGSGYDYHGYHAANFSSVDQRYLSDDIDFQSVIGAAHSRGMKIVLDIVLNHTGNFGEATLCPMFKRDWTANQADINACMIPITDNGRLTESYATSAASSQYAARLAQMKNTDGVNHDSINYWHHFGQFNWDNQTRWWAQIAGDCVDLNTENPATYKYVRECYGKFIEMGVDGFRIDTGGHIARLTFNKAFIPYFQEMGEKYKSKRLNECPFYICTEVCARYQGSVTYRNQPALSPYFYTWQSSSTLTSQWNDDESYWHGLNITESTDMTTLDNIKLCETEYSENSTETSSAMPTSNNALLNGNTYHTPDYTKSSGLNVIDFPVHYSFSSISNVWSLFDSDKYYNDATFNLVYVDSHDYSPGPNDSKRFNGGTDQWAENLDLMFTFRGIPCLYYGSEIEFRAGVTIDNGTNSALKETGRAYFGGYIKGNVTPTGFGTYSEADGNLAATLNHPLAKHIGRLSQIRQKVPALRKGQWSKEGCSATSGYAFKRRYTNGDIDSYALVSINSGATFTNVENGTYTDCVSGDQQTVTNGTLTTRSFSGQGQMCVYVLDGPGKVGEDGPYLFTTTAVTSSATTYDGTEEESSTNNGGKTESGAVSLDSLEVYTPCLNAGETACFYESASNVNAIAIWVWNSTSNFTGGNWDTKPNMTLMGKTTDGTRKIYKWTYSGSVTTAPSNVIFVPAGSNQTADLTYYNGGYYIDGEYSYTVGSCNDYPTVSADKASGTYHDAFTVNLTASETSATIVYTTDGSDPTASSAQAVGSTSINITETTTIKAGILVDGEVYNIVSYTYTITDKTGITIYVTASTAPYLYVWDGNGAEPAGSWPGTLLSQTVTIDGVTYYYMTFTDYTMINIIFNNGNGGQTADITGITEDSYFSYDGTSGYTKLTPPTTSITTPTIQQNYFTIYSISGVRVAQGDDFRTLVARLPKGVYIVNGQKMVLR